MPKSIDKYSDERIELTHKIFNILDLVNNDNMISLKKLDEDVDKQKKILELVDDIKKYFVCSRWTVFCNAGRSCKRPYLSLIKAIMKEMNIKITISRFIKYLDNKSTCDTFYIFNINNLNKS